MIFLRRCVAVVARDALADYFYWVPIDFVPEHTNGILLVGLFLMKYT